MRNAPLTRRALAAAAAAMATLAVPRLGTAQTAAGARWVPERPVRVVIPYAPGGGADTVGRILFAKLGEVLGGANFVIENRAGGAGTIAAAAVAGAAPDGYTLLHDATAFSVNPALFEGRLPYDTRRAFRPVFLAARVPNLMLVHPSVPARSVPEVIALAKASRDGLDFASAGTGSVQHMALEMFARAAGVRLNHIPYRGGGPALTDLIGGQVQFMFSNASASTGHAQAGRVRAVAHTGDAGHRLAAFPALPAAGETLPGFVAYEWNGVFAPAGVPDAVVEGLNAGLNAVIRDPAVAERLAGLNVETLPNTPAEFAAFLEAEMERWGRVVREAGIRPD